MPSINSKYSILATGAVTCRTYTAARAGLALARHDSIVSQLSRIPHGEACLASHTTQPVSHPTRRGLHTRSPLCQTSTDRRALRSMHASRPGSAHVCPPQPHLHLGHMWGEHMSHCLAGRACTSRAHARRVRSPCVFSSANCAASFASARRRPSPPQHAGTLLVMSFAQCGMPAHPMLQAQLRGLATWHHSHPSHATSLWCCQPPHPLGMSACFRRCLLSMCSASLRDLVRHDAGRHAGGLAPMETKAAHCWAPKEAHQRCSRGAGRRRWTARCRTRRRCPGSRPSA